MGPPSGGASGGNNQGSKSNDANAITGHFDPSALERGAAAMKDIDSSPNAGKAFDIIKLQEQTKQQEAAAKMSEMNAQREQAMTQRAQVEGEEQRKTESHRSREAQQTAQYKAQLESELYQKKMEDQQKQNEQMLRMQEDQFLRQEDMRKKTNLEMEEERRRTLTHQHQLDMETMRARALAEGEARTQNEKENVDIHLRHSRAKAAEDRKTRLESIELIFSNVGEGLRSLVDDKDRMTSVVFGLSALAVGVYGARNGTRIAANLLEKYLSKPPLVRETSARSIRNIGSSTPALTHAKMMEQIILPQEMSERLEWTTNSLINAKKNGTPFRHILLHGPPGTGKTLFARTLARQSGMDYAIMSGGDIGPLGADAVDEVNKLFAWANTSKKGMVLFVDEAEAFLRRGRGSEAGMSENSRNVLSAFLHHTGTESDKFMVILATNVRDIMDRAVLDRIDEDFEFPLPDPESRYKMLQLFMKQYITTPTKTGGVIEVDDDINDEYLKKVAERTAGFSGRQLAKLVINYQSAVFGSGTHTLSKSLADICLDWKLANFDLDKDTRGGKF